MLSVHQTMLESAKLSEPVGRGGHGHPRFGQINPVLTSGQIMPPNYYLLPSPPPIFRPSYGPAVKYIWPPKLFNAKAEKLPSFLQVLTNFTVRGLNDGLKVTNF